MSGQGAAESARVVILGVGVDRVDVHRAVARVEAMIAGGGKHQVVVLPVNSVMAARKHPDLRKIVRGASLVVPDGVPILWASRLLGRPLPGRVAGTDLLLALCRRAARKGYTCYFLGSQERVLSRLVRALTDALPQLRVAGAYAPPLFREFPPAESVRMRRRINAARPDILWVGFGAPKQERWIRDNLGALEVKVAVGVGAAFEMASGVVRRAPVWMQRRGLEWFYRFLREPGRLFGRYFVDALPFLPLIAGQWLSERVARRSGR